MLMNHSADRLAIKVRCSNNEFFRVNPVFSFLDPGSMNELEMIRLQGGAARRKDMLQLIYVVCRDNDTGWPPPVVLTCAAVLDATQLFTKRARTKSLVVPLTTI